MIGFNFKHILKSQNLFTQQARPILDGICPLLRSSGDWNVLNILFDPFLLEAKASHKRMHFYFFFVSGSFSLMFPISSSLSSLFRILLLQFPHLGSTLSSFISAWGFIIIRFSFGGGGWVGPLGFLGCGGFLGLLFGHWRLLYPGWLVRLWRFFGKGRLFGIWRFVCIFGGNGRLWRGGYWGLGFLGPGGFLGVLFGHWRLLYPGQLLWLQRFFGQGRLFGIGRFVGVVGGTGRLWRGGYWWLVAGVVFVIGWGIVYSNTQ